MKNHELILTYMWSDVGATTHSFTYTVYKTSPVHTLIQYIYPVEEHSHTSSRPFLYRQAEISYLQGNEMVMRSGALCGPLVDGKPKIQRKFRQG